MIKIERSLRWFPTIHRIIRVCTAFVIEGMYFIIFYLFLKLNKPLILWRLLFWSYEKIFFPWPSFAARQLNIDKKMLQQKKAKLGNLYNQTFSAASDFGSGSGFGFGFGEGSGSGSGFGEGEDFSSPIGPIIIPAPIKTNAISICNLFSLVKNISLSNLAESRYCKIATLCQGVGVIYFWIIPLFSVNFCVR